MAVFLSLGIRGPLGGLQALVRGFQEYLGSLSNQTATP